MNDEPTAVTGRDSPTAPHASPRAARADESAVVRFTDFEFDFQRDQLRRNGTPIPLSPKPAALLRYLLANPQRLVSKTELMASLWAGVVVTDDSLVQCVGELRSRLGDQGSKLITTHPRRGYIFEADVRPIGHIESDERDLVPGLIDPGVHAPAAPPAPHRSAPRRAWRSVAFATALGVFAIAGSAIYMRSAQAPYRIDDEIARRYSLVVTPFSDIGNTPAPKDIRDGLEDEIAAQLSQRQNSIVIRSPSPVGVRYAMTGSISARGAGVAIDLQVKTVPDGVVVWVEHYDYPDANDPGINLDVAVRAVSSLRLRYAERHKARVSAPGYHFDPADLAFSGWDDIDRRQTVQDVARGKARFEEALKADPDSVTALTGLAAALMSERYGYSGEPLPKDVTESERIAAKAISIAPNDPVALISWANVLLFRGQPALALPFYERALQRAPSSANAHLRYAYALMVLGRGDEVQSHIDDALRIGHRDPRVLVSAYSMAAIAAFIAGDDEKAYALSQRALAERPTFGNSYALLASIDALHGRTAEAAKNMAEHRRLMPYNTVERYVINNPSGADSYLAGRNRMVEGLRAAGLPEH